MQLFVVNILVAQNLKESLGGIKTNFQIFSDTIDLKVSDQIIILEADQRHLLDFWDSNDMVYAYQSFHLEFIAKKEIKIETFKYRSGRDNGSKLEIIFYGSADKILASSSIPFKFVDLFSNPSIIDCPFFYSIDLVNIPIVLLDKTSKIGLIKKVATKD